MSLKKTSTYFCVVFLFCVCFSCSPNKQEEFAWQLIEKCKEVQLNMSYSQVIQIMGEPANTVQFVIDEKNKKRIYYPSPELASSPTQFLIDEGSGTIEEIICGEGHILQKK